MRTVIFCLLLIAATIIPVRAAEQDRVSPILPPEALLYFQIPDWNALKDQAESLPMGQLYLSKPMEAFREQLQEHGGTYLLKTFGVDLATVDQYIDDQFVVVGLPGDDGVLTFTTFVQTDSNESAQRLIQQTAGLLQEFGIATASADSQLPELAFPKGTLIAELPKRVGDSFSGGPLLMCALDQCVVLGRDVGATKRLVDRWRSAEDDSALLETEECRTVLEPLQRTDGNLFLWYFDPIRWGANSQPPPEGVDIAAESTAADSTTTDAIESWRPFAMRHGFAGLQAIGGAGWVNPENQHLEFRIRVQAPGPREGSMKMFDFPPGDLSFPSFIHDDAKVATVVRWNVGQILKNVQEVFDDITDAPGAFEATMADLKNELNVDLREEMMPMLGPKIVVMSDYIEADELDATMIAIDIRDPAVNEAKVARMIYQLLVGDTESRRMKVPGQRYELWRMKLMVGNGKSPFSEAGLMVADGRLWIGTHASTLRQHLLKRGGKPLSETTLHRDYLAMMKNRFGSETFGVSLSKMYEDSKYAYETLRVRGPKGLEEVESMYSVLLQIILDEDKSPIDFTTLPPFSEIQQYLHNLIIYSDNSDQGWELHGIVMEGR
ncbi:hypothetical protein [Neorhodopirellula pilleata]|uniref:DUF3352 domain-containing protein n=1 Tax=Neorhodopirellula pilleata TaxID=2714738 RepID=A0A5C6AVK6_9BACT|nr:hypothetical protein [Neorhodopirellula pilleata]TWU03086.1 hypothetical protein Pla100_00040 [Neorhodopirellula pilleata]